MTSHQTDNQNQYFNLILIGKPRPKEGVKSTLDHIKTPIQYLIAKIHRTHSKPKAIIKLI
jgi:hypothetical protein